MTHITLKLIPEKSPETCDGELVRPERCRGCGDYDYQASITPSCRRQVCQRPDSERVRYAMENIVMTDEIIDTMSSRPSVLDRLRKIYRRNA